MSKKFRSYQEEKKARIASAEERQAHKKRTKSSKTGNKALDKAINKSWSSKQKGTAMNDLMSSDSWHRSIGAATINRSTRKKK